MERRYQRRRDRRRARRVGREGTSRELRRGGNKVIVTWNVQGMSVRENNRSRMRRVIDRIAREGWEIVCVTELTAERERVWCGWERMNVGWLWCMVEGVGCCFEGKPSKSG